MIISVDTEKDSADALRRAAKVLLQLADGDDTAAFSAPAFQAPPNPVSRFVPPLPAPSQNAREPEEDAEELLHEAVDVERAVEEEDREERKPAPPAEKPRVKPDLPGGIQIY